MAAADILGWSKPALNLPAGYRCFWSSCADWTRHETYEAARAIVVTNGGGYGMGLAYAREMIHPG